MIKINDIAIVYGWDDRRGLYLNGKLVGMLDNTPGAAYVHTIYPYGLPDGYPKSKPFPKTLKEINEHNKAAISRRRAKVHGGTS